jgi:hypothetical protein
MRQIMKPHSLRHWMPLLASGLLIGLTACENEVVQTTRLPGVQPANVGVPVIMAQVGASAPSVETAEHVVTSPAPTEGTVPVPPQAMAPPKLSPGVDEVVQLAQAQMEDEVLLAYIENSPAPFDLDVHQILYLHDLGLSAQVIAAMVRQSQALDNVESVPAIPEEAGEPALATATPAQEPQVEANAASDTSPPPPTAAAVNVEQGPQQVTNNYFYNALAPYGTWVQDSEYGWSWRPTISVIDVNWRPYVHGGRWVYTDYGWYWNSYYSWGWAPFHYGRWYHSPIRGWIWVPDTHWGPAWVTWRYYDGYYGWAPLPPRAIYTSGIGLTYYGRHVSFGFSFGLGAHYYSFVPIRHFHAHRPWYHCVDRPRVTQIYNNSTVINNYVVGNNNTTIINVGPGTDGVAAATRTEVQKVQIRDVAPGEQRTIRPESLSRDGTSLAVYRPKLPEQSPSPPEQITRRQAELQKRTETVARSDAAQAATIAARRPESGLTRQTSSATSGGARPSSAPRIVRPDSATTSRLPSSAPISPGITQPGAQRSEPRPRDTAVGTSRPTEPARPSGVPAQNQVVPPAMRPTVPVRPPTATSPAPSRPAQPPRTVAPQNPSPAQPQNPRPQAVRPTAPTPAPANPSPRSEPVRPSNPSYSVTPQIAPPRTAQPTRPAQSIAPPNTVPAWQPAARPEPAARPSTPQFTPNLAPSRSAAPTYSRPTAPAAPISSQPSRSVSPAPQSPSIQPRATSPSPAPARPQAAPTAPSRGAGPRPR